VDALAGRVFVVCSVKRCSSVSPSSTVCLLEPSNRIEKILSKRGQVRWPKEIDESKKTAEVWEGSEEMQPRFTMKSFDLFRLNLNGVSFQKCYNITSIAKSSYAQSRVNNDNFRFKKRANGSSLIATS
jgi:hypothetical protein